ncbi:M20/M25/M40 family metallo-hydrolase [uncultured Psychrosphaera sp.]|uniref:M28 family metallopeptidase n=1 Tax=uncultured Psychrosphaera sp. TaxID=1403522 RepID=UPI002614514C|nr:M20/M25/M40 family metallo-hydrolase [uncultured Psychrosphaera sp.]
MKYLLTLCLLFSFSKSVLADDFAWQKLTELTDETSGIGARPAGSDKEKETAAWIKNQWQLLGYTVNEFPFGFSIKGQKLTSENLSITIKGQSEETIVIGAHYDSTGEKQGSLGTTDNGSGVAAILDLANRLKEQKLPITVRLVALGAEEFGLQGSKAYVGQQQESLKHVVGMINLDTIIGGDKLYVHSAHETPYKCKAVSKPNYNSSTKLRDELLSISKDLFTENSHQLHPAFEGYPQGQTGSWSDHSPFACSGMPIAYLEATNFAIDGHSGNDGYSQTTHKEAWNCLKQDGLTACDRDTEKKWGMIWHTEFDRLDKLTVMFKDRLKSQLTQNIDVLEAFVKQPNIQR